SRVLPIPLNNDFPNIPQSHTSPVGGRLQQFHSHWQNITTDQWVLSIIRNGYCLDLTSTPPNIPP
ncbi:hypothetical protein NDU88_002633, partial [Pleurodeles waltl]